MSTEDSPADTQDTPVSSSAMSVAGALFKRLGEREEHLAHEESNSDPVHLHEITYGEILSAESLGGFMAILMEYELLHEGKTMLGVRADEVNLRVGCFLSGLYAKNFETQELLSGTFIVEKIMKFVGRLGLPDDIKLREHFIVLLQKEYEQHATSAMIEPILDGSESGITGGEFNKLRTLIGRDLDGTPLWRNSS